jgi:hypothetical protein
MPETDDEFIQRWSERGHRRALIEYAMHAWRPMDIPPPRDQLLITVCEEGLVLMKLTAAGDWRTSAGTPHKPPKKWMLAPKLPQPEPGDEK